MLTRMLLVLAALVHVTGLGWVIVAVVSGTLREVLAAAVVAVAGVMWASVLHDLASSDPPAAAGTVHQLRQPPNAA